MSHASCYFLSKPLIKLLNIIGNIQWLVIGVLSKAEGKEATPMQCEKEPGKFPRKGVSRGRNLSGGKAQPRKRNGKMASCHCWFTH